MILSRLKEPKELKDDRTETMLKIYEDSSMAADTQHRQALMLSLWKRNIWCNDYDLIEKRKLYFPTEYLLY